MSAHAVSAQTRYYSKDQDGGIERFDDLPKVTVEAEPEVPGFVTVEIGPAERDDPRYPMGYGFEFDLTPDEALVLASILTGVAEGMKK